MFRLLILPYLSFQNFLQIDLGRIFRLVLALQLKSQRTASPRMPSMVKQEACSKMATIRDRRIWEVMMKNDRLNAVEYASPRPRLATVHGRSQSRRRGKRFKLTDQQLLRKMADASLVGSIPFPLNSNLKEGRE